MTDELPSSRPLILVGGGGHCKSVADAALEAGYCIAGILDKSAAAGGSLWGIPVLGGDSLMWQYAATCDFVITVGAIASPTLRMRLYNEVLAAGGRFGTVVARSACVSARATVMPGSVVLRGACVNAGAVVGENCIVNTLAAIEHDAVVGSHSHVSTGAMVNGDCRIGAGVFIGSNATVNQGVAICDGAVIGSGAVVTASIAERGVYAGCPARFIKPTDSQCNE